MTEYTPHLTSQAEGEKREPNYLGVFGALALITLIEVTVVANLPIARVPLLLGLSVAKVLLVAMYYMHLKFQSGWFTAIFLLPIPCVVLITLVLSIALAPAIPAAGSAAAAFGVCSVF